MLSEEVDVLVIGAGPAGTVAASIINKAGFRVKIVEKQVFPRFVIGESLLPRCMEALDEAGFIPAIEAKGYQQKFGAKFIKGDKLSDFSFTDQFTNGWSWTWQVPRADFDKTLADEVERMGVQVAYETAVTDITFNGTNSVTVVENSEGIKTAIHARFIVDGSGYGRVIPQLFGLDRPSVLSERRAMFAHLADTKRALSGEPNRIIIIVHKPGVWVWVIPFSNGCTSLGFVGSPGFFDAYQGTDEEILRRLISSNTILQERFQDTEIMLGPKVLQGWSCTTDKFYGNGYVLTGNVTEFLDPIFSSGVTLATVSAQNAAHLVIRTLNGGRVDWDKEYMEPVLQGVDTFRSYVNAWYDGTLDTIFFTDKPKDWIKTMICSVLAGYVWDTTNPYVKDHATALKRLARMITLNDMATND